MAQRFNSQDKCYAIKSVYSVFDNILIRKTVYSELKAVKSGVPQGSVLEPFLYLPYTSDIELSEEVKISKFADDTAILPTVQTVLEATIKKVAYFPTLLSL